MKDEYKRRERIIEYPRIDDSDNQPEYCSDVYDIRDVERNNIKNLHEFNKPKRGTCLHTVKENFADRKNTRSEWEFDKHHYGVNNKTIKYEDD